MGSHCRIDHQDFLVTGNIHQRSLDVGFSENSSCIPKWPSNTVIGKMMTSLISQGLLGLSQYFQTTPALTGVDPLDSRTPQLTIGQVLSAQDSALQDTLSRC